MSASLRVTRYMARLSLLLSGVACAVPAAGQTAATGPEPERIRIDVGLVSSINDIEVPARLKGFINQLQVEEGDEMQQGGTLAILDSTTIESELAAARIRRANAERQATDDTALKYAQATLDVASKELEINIGLNQRNALSDQELERSRLSRIQAELQVQRSLAQMDIDRGAVDLEDQSMAAVEELLKRHTIVAPFTGQVIKVNRRAGEYIQEGQTLLRLVDLSQVKVEGSVSVREVNPDQLSGKRVIVSLSLAGGETATFNGAIKSIGLETRLDGTYVVQAIVQNEKRGSEWLLRPNSTVQMEVLLRDNVPSISGDVPSIPGDVPSLSGDVPSLSGDVPSIPGDVPSIPGDVPSIPGDVPSIPGDRIRQNSPVR